MLRAVIAGNVEKCRTEAEVWDESGNKLAVIYEDLSGWHTEPSESLSDRESPEIKTLVEGLKQELSRFVNRMGQDPPENASAGVLALWLMKNKKRWFW